MREQIQRDRGEKDKERARDGGLLGQWSTQISGLTDTSGMPSQWLTRAILHSAVPPRKNNNPGRRKPPLTFFLLNDERDTLKDFFKLPVLCVMSLA